MDDLRFLPQQSPRSEAPSSTISSIVSPPRNNGTSRISQQPIAHDTRSNLPRRFTTDSGRIPTLASMNSQSRGTEPVQEYGNVGGPFLTFAWLNLIQLSSCFISLCDILTLPQQTFHKVQLVRPDFGFFAFAFDFTKLRWRRIYIVASAHLVAPMTWFSSLSLDKSTNRHPRLNRKSRNTNASANNVVSLSWKCRSLINASAAKLTSLLKWRKRLSDWVATSLSLPLLRNIAIPTRAFLACSRDQTAIRRRASHPRPACLTDLDDLDRSSPLLRLDWSSSNKPTMDLESPCLCRLDLSQALVGTATTRRRRLSVKIPPATVQRMRKSAPAILGLYSERRCN